VVVFADPDLTAREFDELADAVHKWMYPTDPPEAWLSPDRVISSETPRPIARGGTVSPIVTTTLIRR
jgi:hypothetical protein